MNDVLIAPPSRRLLAKAVDLVVVSLLAGPPILYPVGPFLGFLYSIVADGFRVGRLRGQSVGKKLLGLQVIELKDEEPCDWMHSIVRNAPVGVATFFGMIPVAGWIVAMLLGIPLLILEVVLMFKAHHGRRLGDSMAQTEVVIAKHA